MAERGADDRRLLELAGAGDPAGFEGLYEAHRGWLAALAERFTDDREDALDVMQETFSDLFLRIPGFELKSTLRAYLYPVIKHRSISLIRRRRKIVPLERDSSPPPQLTYWPDEPGEMARLIDPLNGEQRELVLLRFALGMKLQEIAAALALPLGTVKSRLHGALRKLKKIMPVEEDPAVS